MYYPFPSVKFSCLVSKSLGTITIYKTVLCVPVNQCQTVWMMSGSACDYAGCRGTFAT